MPRYIRLGIFRDGRVRTPFRAAPASITDIFAPELDTGDVNKPALADKTTRYLHYNQCLLNYAPNPGGPAALTIYNALCLALRNALRLPGKEAAYMRVSLETHVEAHSGQETDFLRIEHPPSGLDARLQLFRNAGAVRIWQPVLYFHGLVEPFYAEKLRAVFDILAGKIPPMIHAAIALTRALKSCLAECGRMDNRPVFDGLVLGGHSLGAAIATVAGAVNDVDSFNCNGLELGGRAQEWVDRANDRHGRKVVDLNSVLFTEEKDRAADSRLQRVAGCLIGLFTRRPAKRGIELLFREGRHDASLLTGPPAPRHRPPRFQDSWQQSGGDDQPLLPEYTPVSSLAPRRDKPDRRIADEGAPRKQIHAPLVNQLARPVKR